jgi:hypothetical protein
MTFKKHIFILIFVLFCTSGIYSQVNKSRDIANYQIEVRLDTKRKLVEGTEILTWFNNTDDNVTNLQFHLYQNAYKNSKSTFYKNNSFQLGRFDTGYTEIKFFKIIDGSMETPRLAFIQPDDGNPYDETVLNVKLPSPIKPGKMIRLNIGFITKLPQGGIGRSGYARGREFYFLSQWFPKIGVYEEGKGWNCHQFHEWTEFYSDFGRYEVKVTLPHKFIIGATGKRIKEEENRDKTITYTYAEENIHDFAWTAEPEFIEVQDAFVDSVLKPVRIILLMQPEHKDQIDVHLQTIKKCLKYFGSLLGEYPYSNITVIDPPTTSSSRAMEYPGLITIGTNYIYKQNELTPENTIIYEFIHQYWYGIIANNEFEEAWLDEGITTYYTAKFLEEQYSDPLRYIRIGGGVPLRAFPLITYDEFPIVAYMESVNIPPFIKVKQGYLQNPLVDPIYKKAWLYQDRSTYRIGSYYKPALMLKTLEGYLGEETMKKIMKDFFQSYKYKHPNTGNFIDMVEKYKGKDLSWFFSQILYGTEALDYAVTDISNANMESGYRIDVIVTRLGGVKFPVEIKVTLENGDSFKDYWDGNDKWIRKTYFTTSPAIGAQIDPENKLILDVNSSNNNRLAKYELSPFLRWVTQWLFWMQSFLQAIISIC